MKTIYRVYDLYNGNIYWSKKSELSLTINAMEARIRVKRMDELSLSPKMPLNEMAALQDFVSENIEIETLETEEALINLVNNWYA